MSLIPRYISPRGLEAIAAHKYKAGEYSILDGYMNVWWTAVAERLPMWLAPNLITLIGTVAIMSTVLVQENAKQECAATGSVALPPWVHAYIIAAQFFYQTMDAIDGKQARRTGSSSPLGQLFDHGCDALVAAIQARNLALCFGLGSHWLGTWALVGTTVVFFAGQWEEYFTRVLRTAPTRYMGVTEVQFIAMGVHAAAAVLPCEFWHAPASLPLHRLPPDVQRALPAWIATEWATLPLNEWIGYGLLAIMAQGLARFVLNLAVYHPHPDGGAGRVKALTYLLPTLALGATAMYLSHPAGQRATHYLAHPDVAGGAVAVAYALAQTSVTTQMIVYSMCQDPFPVASQAVAVLFPALAAVATLYPLPVSVRCLHAFLGGAALLYLSFVSGAMRQITTQLGIRAFVITPKPPAAAAVTSTAPAAATSLAPATLVARSPAAAVRASFPVEDICSVEEEEENGQGQKLEEEQRRETARMSTARPKKKKTIVVAAEAPRRTETATTAASSATRSSTGASRSSRSRSKSVAGRSSSTAARSASVSRKRK